MVTPSGLCVGLDPDIEKMPPRFRQIAGIVDFMREIIAATRPAASAYKINTAFFEQYGLPGMQALADVREAVGNSFCIIDAKRADIGNTSSAYARALFGELRADAVTVAPYMGRDSVAPFLDLGMTYILALTSNQGSADFQYQRITTPTGQLPLYEHVMHTALGWKGAHELGFVVGATHTDELKSLRAKFPTTPFLIPGIGAQGADARSSAAANGEGPALFNVGRTILYCSADDSFAEQAGAVARQLASDLSR